MDTSVNFRKPPFVNGTFPSPNKQYTFRTVVPEVSFFMGNPLYKYLTPTVDLEDKGFASGELPV